MMKLVTQICLFNQYSVLFLLISCLSRPGLSNVINEKNNIKEIILLSPENRHQLCKAESELPVSFRIRLIDSTGEDLSAIPIEIRVISSPGKDNDYLLSNQTIFSDPSGNVQFNFTTGKKAGIYLISAQTIGNYHSNALIFEVEVKEKSWIFILCIGLIGGLALFLYGMHIMSEGLQNSAGDKMRTILNRLTYNRFVALAVGAFITMIIQSSSTTNVMVIGFVNSKLMRFKQTIGIILGAAIGTTITAQIIAFKITDYSLVFIIIGFALYFLTRKRLLSEIGKAVLGFGLLFYGMHIMSEAMYPLRSYPPFIQIITHLENPVLGIFIGVILTALIQSSSAFIGILIILSMQGLITLEASVSLVIGANIGTAITAILASVGANRESKQVALAHTLFKITGAIIIAFFIPYFVELVNNLSFGQTINEPGQATARQIANAHTIYNVLLCLLFLPFTDSFARLVNKILPIKDLPTGKFQTKYLDPVLTTTPILALDLAREELIRLMETVLNMTNQIIDCFIEKNRKVIPLISSDEEKVNFLRDKLTDYLLEISRQDVAESIVEESFILLNTVKEYEEIADLVSGPLLSKGESWCQGSWEFSEKGKEELKNYHTSTIKLMLNSMKLYQKFDLKKAKKMKENYKKNRQKFFELEEQHFERLQNNIKESIESSKTHLEVMTSLKVINSHVTNTARIIILHPPKKKQSCNGKGKSKN